MSFFIVYMVGFTLIGECPASRKKEKKREEKENQRNACGIKNPLNKESELRFLFSALRLIRINYQRNPRGWE